jgi:hypothetical protein
MIMNTKTRSVFILGVFGEILTQNLSFFMDKNCPNFEVVAFFPHAYFFLNLTYILQLNCLYIILKIQAGFQGLRV